MPILLLSSLSWIVVIFVGGDCCYRLYELIVIIVVMDLFCHYCLIGLIVVVIVVMNTILWMIFKAYVVSVYIDTIDKPNK